ICQRLADAGVVAALLDVAFERLGIGASAEPPTRTRDDNDADISIAFRAVDAPAILGVHPAGPRVQTVRPAEGDRRDAVLDRIGCGLQIHRRRLYGTGRPQRRAQLRYAL